MRVSLTSRKRPSARRHTTQAKAAKGAGGGSRADAGPCTWLRCTASGVRPCREQHPSHTWGVGDVAFEQHQVAQHAVQRGQVQVIRNGLKKRVPIKIGAADAEWVEVLDDSLQMDDRIIIPRRQ